MESHLLLKESLSRAIRFKMTTAEKCTNESRKLDFKLQFYPEKYFYIFKYPALNDKCGYASFNNCH